MVKDNKVMISGMFQSRWNSETDFEFKIQRIMLLDNVKTQLTKRINLELTLQRLNDDFVHNISKYVDKSGNCELGIQIVDEQNREKTKLQSSFKKVNMSDGFLEELKKMEGVAYQVITA
jgi:DNA polymerase-3 subunit alpha